MRKQTAKGMCDSCQEVGQLHNTDENEWLCQSCKDMVYGKTQTLELHQVNGRGFITGLGL